MNERESRVLSALKTHFEKADAAAERIGMSYSALMSVVSGLERDKFVEVRKESRKFASLTPEGREYLERGLPEKRLFEAVGNEMGLREAIEKAGLVGTEKTIALQWIIKKGWAKIEKRDGKSYLKLLVSKSRVAEEKTIELIGGEREELKKLNQEELNELTSRGLVRVSEERAFHLRICGKGEKALREEKTDSGISQLTPEMLKSGKWAAKKFREYSLETAVVPLKIGKKQFYLEFLSEIKEKLVGIGFREAHGPLVETEFWNMDVLFMAQDHPAREVHDIFKVREPENGRILDKTLKERVYASHKHGGKTGSTGWGYEWNAEIAVRLVLRSQTTAVSARELAKDPNPPQRVFAVGKCFRPDQIDWAHFVEFNQCEGIVVDEGMTFRELLGYLRSFAIDIAGAEDAKFRPSYFPFTEPSVELLAKIPGRGWIEVGGAGMFRPEMLEALGVEVPVLAWGLGIDRLAMIKLGVKDIRHLLTQDIEMLRSKSY
ncbi:phenylalanine--tRNA ligase subunit alpha [Candidatus Micrarchaeota archaeon]|nr:phenylalanine--tRNA ligase subunit alpha [Candidatus Micrarchaeota archaeon]